MFDPRPFWMLDEWLRDLQAGAGINGFSELPGFEQEDGKLVMRVEVPGLEAGDIDVQVHERTVTVRAERKDPVPEGFRVLRRERGGEISTARTVTLPANADPDRCDADLRDGVLTLTFQQRTQSGPRRIALGEGRT